MMYNCGTQRQPGEGLALRVYGSSPAPKLPVAKETRVSSAGHTMMDLWLNSSPDTHWIVKATYSVLSHAHTSHNNNIA